MTSRFSLIVQVAWICLAGCGAPPDAFVPPEPALDGHAASVSQQLRTDRELARAKPDDAAAVGTYGMTLQLYKQYAAADACYRRAIEIDPEAFRWHYFLAIARHDDGRTKEAIAALRDALKLDPAYAPAYVKLAEWLLLDGDAAAARTAAEEAVRRTPASVRAHVALGKAVEASDGAAPAIATFQKAVGIAPADAAARYQLAMAYRQTGRLDEARAELALHERYRERISIEDDPLLQELQDRYAGADMWIRLGKSLLEQREFSQAERFFKRALELDREAVLAHANLIAVYGEMGRWPEAEAAYRDAAAIDARNWQAHFNYGILEAKRGEYRRAASALRAVIAAKPDEADAHAALAVTLARLNQAVQAEEHYDTALTLQPENPSANAVWAEYLLAAGRTSAAIDPLLRAALIPNANARSARQLLTTTYGRLGGPSQAAGVVKRALDRARKSASPVLVNAMEAEWTQLEQGRIPR